MREKFLKLSDVIGLGLAALLTHLSIFVCYARDADPPRPCSYASPQMQLSILFGMVLFILWRNRFQGEENSFWATWRRNWLVGLFIGLAFLSLGWTALFSATIYRSILILFTAWIAAYVGYRFSPRNLVDFIAVVIGVFAAASLLVALVWPSAGITWAYAYEGLWRGIFWHKIYLGATMALGYIAYLVILFSPASQYNLVHKSLAAVMLALCTVLAVLSNSASGLVVFAIQTGLFILVKAWLAWGGRISRRGYWILGGVAALGLVLVLANLGFIFGLFGRSATMTGRIPMWSHVFEAYVLQRPLLGHGFGAFWLQPGINQQVQSVVGWYYPVKVADNGYLDVLLGLGVIGLVLLLAMLATGLWRALRVAVQGRDLISFFPLFMLAHIIFINISLSYIVEMESFIWFLLVAILFMVSKDVGHVSVGHASSVTIGINVTGLFW